MTLNEELVNKTLENHSETLYGKDGCGGLVRSDALKVSYKVLWTALLALAIPLVPSLIYMWSFTTNAHNIFATKDAVAVVVQTSAIIDERLDYANAKIEEIREGIKELQKSQAAILQELRRK